MEADLLTLPVSTRWETTERLEINEEGVLKKKTALCYCDANTLLMASLDLTGFLFQPLPLTMEKMEL